MVVSVIILVQAKHEGARDGKTSIQHYSCSCHIGRIDWGFCLVEVGKLAMIKPPKRIPRSN